MDLPRPLRLRVYLTVTSFLVGVSVLFYRGPGWRLWRAHGGDVLVVIFLVSLLGFVAPRWWKTRVALVALAGVAAELWQLVFPREGELSLARELTVGSTFDPWDLLAYALGLTLVGLLERGRLRPEASHSP